jgi:hypothetical protein
MGLTARSNNIVFALRTSSEAVYYLLHVSMTLYAVQRECPPPPSPKGILPCCALNT